MTFTIMCNDFQFFKDIWHYVKQMYYKNEYYNYCKSNEISSTYGFELV